MRVLPLSVQKEPLMTVVQTGIDKEKLVYLMLASKKLKYRKGKSKIVYIGTTKNGIHRVAQSAAERAGKVLKLHGVTKMDFHLVTYKGKRGLTKAWGKLERAMILEFRSIYGEIPKCNTQGKNFIETGAFIHFSKTRINTIIKNFEDGV